MAMVDNKKIRYVILLWGLVIVSLMIPCVAAAPPTTGHPYMLFHDISETPGYQYRTMDPWKGWESGIITSAYISLSQNFSGNMGDYNRLVYRGAFTKDLGLAYQITKDSKYALKTREALLNLDVGDVPYRFDRAEALGSYSLAYDWVQPTLDTANDTIIRDKLATMADTAYKDLNDNGKDLGNIDFADYQGKAYPMLGVASAALYDYTNPNHLPLSTTPADWKKVGTDYLFVNDKLHSNGRSLFSFGFDEDSGKHLNGAYKAYVVDEFATWFQVSNHAYGENLLEIYPAAKKAFTSEVWESLPNQYSSNYVTNGNIGWTYQKGIVNLLTDTEKTTVLNHIDRLEKSTILPHSEILGGKTNGLISNELLYCVYGNYDSIPRTFPTTTSHLDSASIYQVFRENWNDDADWLSLVTFNKFSRSNRDMLHNDQLSIEYYSRGDLLLADAGEDKYLLDRNYGGKEIHHNTISIENPRTSFGVSPWSGSSSAGIYKGDATGLVTPATVDTIIQMPWVQMIQTQVMVTAVMPLSYANRVTLSSPINYERTILYPDSDYFIIVDRMEGTESWVYRNIFRPTSLTITPTADANRDGVYAESEVGHVNGALTIGSTPYNWQSLAYKTETNTGITANSLIWTTTNPYGKAVTMNLFSSPSSEILVEKNVGRIAGYDAPSEVFSPIVWFRTPAANSEYRVTALLSSYSNEQAKNAQEIAVTGTGHAIKVSSASSDDYIYTGKGTSSFAGFTTDADTVYIRKHGDNVQVTLLGGTYLKYQNVPWIALSKKADSMTVNREKDLTDYRIQGEPDLQGDIFQQPVDSNKIEKRTNSNKQQKNTEQQNPMVKSDTNAVSEESSDMILVKLGKIVLSIFASKTTNG
jgi:hypothetical protein